MSVIGKVSATERVPSTVNEFVFWVKDGIEIAPFDIVKTSLMIGSKKSTTFAIVKDIMHITDSPGHLTNYVSSDFGDVTSTYTTQRLRMTYVTAEVIYNDKEIYMPCQDGSLVEFVTESEVKKALGMDNISNPLPAGMFKMSNNISVPILFNSDFLIGPEGAHMNISGISGLATKTSYAMFVLQAIQQCIGDVSIIIFNVKGNDLLRIDEHNPLLKENQIKDWELLGLKCKPFENVKLFYPYCVDSSNYYACTSCSKEALSNQIEDNKTFNYMYTYDHDKSKIDLLFSNVDDPQFTMDSILNLIADKQDFENLSWDEFKSKIGEYTQKGQSKQSDINVQSWRKFRRLINKSIVNQIFQSSRSGTKEKRQIFLSDEINKIKRGEVFVVDISKLEEQLQCFVFGDVIKSVYDLKIGETNRDEDDIPKNIIIFVDELNKYASSNAPKNSPILNYILEITERGRSMGIVLFSAEQFRSAVHDRAKGNCSTHIFGRTNAIEISKPDYKFIPKIFSNMMTRLNKGDLLVEHPVFRSLLKLSFPFPSYYQRSGKE